MTNKKYKTLVGRVALFVVLLLIAFPFIWLFISSFKYEKDIISFPPRIFADKYTFDNYVKVWTTIPLVN